MFRIFVGQVHAASNERIYVAGVNQEHQVVQTTVGTEFATQFATKQKAQRWIDTYVDAGFGLRSVTNTIEIVPVETPEMIAIRMAAQATNMRCGLDRDREGKFTLGFYVGTRYYQIRRKTARAIRSLAVKLNLEAIDRIS